MMRKEYLLILLLAMIQLHCKKGHPFGTLGEQVIKERPAASFSQIILYDNVNLYITQDTIERIRVQAPEKIEPYITTEIIDHSLWIRNTNAAILLNPDEKIDVFVSVKSLGRIDFKGAGTVRSTNTIEREYFYVISEYAAGDVHLKLNTRVTEAFLYSDVSDFILEGTTDSCYAYCGTMGTLDFRNFQAKRMGMDYSSIRNAYVSVSEHLAGTIYFKGNVYYRGNPSKLNVQTPKEGRFIPY